jgi:hypothetical protein
MMVSIKRLCELAEFLESTPEPGHDLFSEEEVEVLSYRGPVYDPDGNRGFASTRFKSDSPGAYSYEGLSLVVVDPKDPTIQCHSSGVTHDEVERCWYLGQLKLGLLDTENP